MKRNKPVSRWLVTVLLAMCVVGVVTLKWSTIGSAALLNLALIDPGYGVEEADPSSTLETSRFMTAAMKMHPDYSRAYYHLGRAAFLGHDFEQAASWLEKAKLTLDDDLVAFSLGLAYYEQGLQERGVAELRRIERIRSYFTQKGRKWASVHDLQIAIAIDPSDQSAYHALGYVYWKQYRRDQAVEVCKKLD